jgi:hypothetical protein
VQPPSLDFHIMAERFTYNFARKKIKKLVSKEAYTDMLRYLQRSGVRFVSLQRPHDLVEIVLVCAGMKDMIGLSYDEIIDALADKKELFPKAVQTNVKRARGLLAAWRRQYVTPGTPADWRRAADRTGLPEWLSNVRIWLDSTDIKIARYRDVKSAGGNNWSGKIGCPAQRVMMGSDAIGIIRFCSSSYFPKKHDSEWVVEHKDELREKFGGATIIADNHFWTASKQLRDPKIIATPAENITVEEARAARFATTKADLRTRRRDVKTVRSRVEAPFSGIKRTFRSLQGEPYMPWREDFEELDNTVSWACGVHNFKKLRFTECVECLSPC